MYTERAAALPHVIAWRSVVPLGVPADELVDQLIPLADQAHLAREVRALAGVPLTTLIQ